MYGRGGQGIKTAAHIIGTAAFLSGCNVQDQPLYGAERRGAPISAYVRISDKPILERGQIDNPSLAVIADDSLLDTPSDNPLESVTKDTMVLINTSQSLSEAISKYKRDAVIVADLTKLSYDFIHATIPGVAIASATCKLLQLNFEDVKKSIIKELDGIRVSHEDIVKNLELARASFDIIPQTVMVTHAKPSLRQSSIVEPKYHHPTVSTCSITATGNSTLRSRGQWSNYKPVIDYENCTKCMICYVYCPDGAFTIDSKGYPIVDYDACKGCDICKTECPVKVITLVRRTKS